MEKGISYLNKTFSDFREALIAYSKKYYPDVALNYDDASIGSFLIDLNADVADNLGYHLDRVYQETNIDSAQENTSLYNLARNLGMKIPGPKGAMAEVAFKCTLPVLNNAPDYDYAPLIKRGTKVSSASQMFEIMDDVDFSKQFNADGCSDRTIRPVYDSNGIVISYSITKLAVVVAGDTRIYRQSLYASDISPFMEIIIPVQDVMNIESVVMVDGTDLQATPTYGAFYSDSEETCYAGQTRFFEVDSLAETERWATVSNQGMPVKYEYGYTTDEGKVVPVYSITKGAWVPVEHKFITEYTDKGYMKLTFGAGNGETVKPSDIAGASPFAKYQITRMMNNKNLGVLPDPETTIFVLYRVGGGKASNVAKGAINRISSLNVEIGGPNNTTVATVRNSISVESVTPSVSGKDMPTEAELKYMIKYNNAAQGRCVTVKDYVNRVYMLPPKYGTPFRVGAAEENNKIMLYLLGIDYKGNLDAKVPTTLINNIKDYLSEYRMINDYVEIKSGRIINLGFEADVMIDKTYNKSDVTKAIIEVIKNYMDINTHNMGENIYVGDLEKEISKTDGVINLMSLRVYNKCGTGYSPTRIPQPVITETDGCNNDKYIEYLGDGYTYLIDLDATDGVLYNEGDCMMEIKKPDDGDIVVRVKTR